MAQEEKQRFAEQMKVEERVQVWYSLDLLV